MKILHICTNFWPLTGGIEQFVLELARRTAALGAEPSVLCHSRPTGFPVQPVRDQIDGIPITRVPFLNLKYYKPIWLPLEVLRRADVLHVHGIGAPLDEIALMQPLHGRPIVVSTHGGIFHTPMLSKLKHWYFDHIVRLSGRHVSLFLACSKNDYRMFSPVAQRMTLLENGVALPATMTVVRDHNRLLHVGRLSDNKRSENLLTTVARLRQLGRRVTLRLVGPDWAGKVQQLKVLAKSLSLEEELQIVGEVSSQQLAVEYASAGWMVSGSQFEGFGLSLIEGMSAGCVPIVNRIPVFADLIDDSRNGYLVDFADSDATAKRMNQLLAAPPPSEVAAAARATALQYSWDSKTPQFMQVYRGVSEAFER